MLQEDNKVAKPKLPEETEKRKIKPKKVVLLVLFAILALAILIAIGIAIIGLIQNPTNTFIVENGTLSSEENAVGYVLRDETVVQGQNYKNGMEKLKTEGEKVAKGEAVFRYYTNGEEQLVQKIEELDTKIAEAWESENNIFSADIKILETDIAEKLDDVYEVSDLQKIKEYKRDINSAITKKAKIAGELSPSGSYLKGLIEERSTYENQLNSGSEYVSAPSSGIVSYRVDGLEETLTPDNFGLLSKEFLEGLSLKTGEIVSTSEESGKVIDNFSCYIACVLSSDLSKQAEIGDTVSLRLSNASEVEATIEYIAQENENESVVVFKIDRYVEELISYRKISLDIIWWSADGLKVPNEAIKWENEDLAYVVRRRAGYDDKKIYVKVLKENSQYAIIENYTDSQELEDKGVSEEEISARSKIALYDEIVL